MKSPNTYSTIALDKTIEYVIDVHFADINGEHKFHFGRETIAERHNTFWLQKDAIYKEDFLFRMLIIQEMGIIEYINAKYTNIFLKRRKEHARNHNRLPDPEPSHKIQFKHIRSILAVVRTMLVLALFILVMEFILFQVATFAVVKYFFVGFHFQC